MHTAYRGEPCLGGDRDGASAANPDAGGGDGHLFSPEATRLAQKRVTTPRPSCPTGIGGFALAWVVAARRITWWLGPR
jgi:hypothetical protein